MADYVRRLVSGNKARHKDNELDVELDLSYITDNVIVMGYPASGIEGFYRNRREDAKKFLEHHHGKNYWVFNFCPVKENSYSADFFEGRVSRYPFPDHHAPPLAILPLVAREIRLWLDDSHDRVAVLHCKAGKGRSGTMACAYLLTLDVAPSAPHLERSLTQKEKTKARAEQVMDAMPVDGDAAEIIGATEQSGEDPVKLELTDGNGGSDGNSGAQASATAPEDTSPKTTSARKDTTNSLSHVLDLHTSRRMKRPSSPSAKLKQGVSIPSQRRWLYYWSLILAHQAPPDFWSMGMGVDAAMADPAAAATRRPSPKVRLTQIRVRMRELSGLKGNLVRAANALLDNAAKKKIDVRSAKAASQVWASLARYDDEFVDTLERWERHTRDESGAMGVRRKGSEHMGGETIGDLFKDGRWDGKKMVRSFARMSTLRDDDIHKETSEEGDKIETLILRPVTGDKWQSIRKKIEADEQAQGNEGTASAGVEGEDTSVYDVTQTLKTDGGVVLDAHREVRVKLYLGQVFMGWFWFIPTFHMHHPRGQAQDSATLHLTRKELDFPVGIGANLVDVDVSMEWCSEAADIVSPPERVSSAEMEVGMGEPAGVVLPAVTSTEAREIAETRQAADD